MTQHTVLHRAAALAAEYLAGLPTRSVAPTPAALARLHSLDRPFPDGPADPTAVLEELHAVGSPATMATAGGRFFGFVVGGSLPAALAASWLAAAWDQDAGLAVLAPGAAAFEEVALRWLLDALGLPPDCAGGFVTGATMANFTALAAARQAVLRRAGRTRVTRVPTDPLGRIRADRLPPLDDRTIVCLQAGNVNTGACDPVRDICPAAHARGAWVHVDGAFGLWAAAAPARAHLVAGIAAADSWALDAHKWLNVPYDSGVALCRDGAALRAAMATQAAYLLQGTGREPDEYTPELSRRARGVEIWAALAALGRSGLADLVERCCRHAARFAAELSAAGHEILNEVTLNQVLVRFGDDATTRRVIAALQAEGTCWCGGTVWQGRTAMRISVSSWATTEQDVEHSLAAMIRIART